MKILFITLLCMCIFGCGNQEMANDEIMKIEKRVSDDVELGLRKYADKERSCQELLKGIINKNDLMKAMGPPNKYFKHGLGVAIVNDNSTANKVPALNDGEECLRYFYLLSKPLVKKYEITNGHVSHIKYYIPALIMSVIIDKDSIIQTVSFDLDGE